MHEIFDDNKTSQGKIVGKKGRGRPRGYIIENKMPKLPRNEESAKKSEDWLQRQGIVLGR